MKYLGQNFQQSLIFYAFLIFKVLEFKQIWPKMKDSFMIMETGQKLTSREKSFKADFIKKAHTYKLIFPLSNILI